jgi:hypothetical protein
VLFAWDITVTANTLEDDPKEQLMKLTHGVITGVEVKFPSGCHGMVNVRILHEESILIPAGKDTWITGDDEAVISNEYFELLTEPYQLKFIGYSEGTDYNHHITVRVTIQPYWLAAASKTLGKLVDLIMRLLGVPQ